MAAVFDLTFASIDDMPLESSARRLIQARSAKLFCLSTHPTTFGQMSPCISFVSVSNVPTSTSDSQSSAISPSEASKSATTFGRATTNSSFCLRRRARNRSTNFYIRKKRKKKKRMTARQRNRRPRLRRCDFSDACIIYIFQSLLISILCYRHPNLDFIG